LNEQNGHEQEPTNACRPLQHIPVVVHEPFASIKSGENCDDPPLEMEFMLLFSQIRGTSTSNFSLEREREPINACSRSQFGPGVLREHYATIKSEENGVGPSFDCLNGSMQPLVRPWHWEILKP
jgi:hypothetical protein